MTLNGADSTQRFLATVPGQGRSGQGLSVLWPAPSTSQEGILKGCSINFTPPPTEGWAVHRVGLNLNLRLFLSALPSPSLGSASRPPPKGICFCWNLPAH